MWRDRDARGHPSQVGPSRRSLLAVPAVAALAVAGCSGPEPSPSSPPTTDAAPRLVGPDGFAAEVDGGERFVLNVHTPDEGSIEGTDASIPFDELEARAQDLPTDRATPLAVYCRTGRMSEVAVGTLARMGFDDVVELRGGMVAWTDSGRMLTAAAAGSSGLGSAGGAG